MSLLSWPEPNCPSALKPIMVLASALIWLALASLVTRYAPPSGVWPILPVAAVFLTSAFVGGSFIAILTVVLYALVLHFGIFNLQLPAEARAILTSGYGQRDFIMFLVFVWLCGVPHWQSRNSLIFTLLWGLTIVFAPVLFVLIRHYVIYGHLPNMIIKRFLNQDFLLAWGLTIIVAAVAAKILYLLKDYLRRVMV